MAAYVVSEALANTARHADASHARVRVHARGGQLTIEVTDDGCGGALSGAGSLLLGLRDRVEELRGRLNVVSPPGRGTTMRAELPLRGQ